MTKSLLVSSRPQWVEARRSSLQKLHDEAVLKRRRRTSPLIATAPLYAAIWWLISPDGPVNVFIAFGMMICLFVSGISISVLNDLAKEGRRRVFVLSETGNDPASVVPALDDLITTMRNPTGDQRRLLASYENAIDRMQAMIPDHPLAQLVAYGYLPSRPERSVNDSTYIVNHDDDKDAEHWERATAALEKLRTLLKTEGPITIDQVVKGIGDVVPPLRAVLRHRDVPTWRIERVPPSSRAAAMAIQSGAVQSSAPLAAPSQTTELPAPAPVAMRPEPEADAITPVEDRLNAAANMAAMELRSIVTAFRSANPSLFQGDDLQTAERMLDDHLPRLVDAFVAADDASEGQERDLMRANFARSLGFLRDSMGGIMDRHARSARQLLEMESRFIETSHGPGDARLAP